MNFYEGGNQENHEDNFTKAPETQTDDSLDEIKMIEDIELSDEMQKKRAECNNASFAFFIFFSLFYIMWYSCYLSASS